MKDIDHIYIDYNDTLRRADSINELAQKIRTVSSADLDEIGCGINAFWKGDAAEMYKKKIFEMSERLEKYSDNLTKASDGIKNAALRLRQMEESAIALFENRRK